MARKKTAPKRFSFLEAFRAPGRDSDSAKRFRWGWRAFRGFLLLALVGGGAFGLVRLRQRVLASPRMRSPPRIQLVDVPPDLSDVMKSAMEPFLKASVANPTLCADIAETLRGVGWVAEVRSVRLFPDRRVEVRCTYRRPAALVQCGASFYLIDENCVRLPGRYANDSTLPLIQGVGAPPPAPGETWRGQDVRAGLRVAQIVFDEPFASQITAVLVHNYGGREDPRAAHLLLATDRAGGRIIWGSAPGEEIEENDVKAKLRALRSNYRRFGRVDANRALIDISVHPDRVIAPA